MHTSKVTIRKGALGRPAGEVYQLSVLFIEGDGWWSAQCLEHDIAAQAKTLNALFYEMERVLVSQLAIDEELGRKPFEGIGRAPKKYWEAFRRSRTTMERPAAGLKSKKSKRPNIVPTFKVAELAA